MAIVETMKAGSRKAERSIMARGGERGKRLRMVVTGKAKEANTMNAITRVAQPKPMRVWSCSKAMVKMIAPTLSGQHGDLACITKKTDQGYYQWPRCPSLKRACWKSTVARLQRTA